MQHLITCRQTAHEGSPRNVLHLSSIYGIIDIHRDPLLSWWYYALAICVSVQFPSSSKSYMYMYIVYWASFFSCTVYNHLKNKACSQQDAASYNVKDARTYCIINEQNQPAAKECNRKLYYIDKNSKNLFSASENGTLTVSDRSTTRVPKK